MYSSVLVDMIELTDSQIWASPQTCTFFKSSCAQVEVPTLELLLWIWTHWASLYQFHDCILFLCKVAFLLTDSFDILMSQWQGIDQFILITDATDKVPDLKNKSYADFQHFKRDWDKLDVIRMVIQVLYSAHAEFFIKAFYMSSLQMRSSHSQVPTTQQYG